MAPPDNGLGWEPTAGAGLPALARRPRALACPVAGAIGVRAPLRVIVFIGAQVCQVALAPAGAVRVSLQSDAVQKHRAGRLCAFGGLGARQQHGRRSAGASGAARRGTRCTGVVQGCAVLATQHTPA